MSKVGMAQDFLSTAARFLKQLDLPASALRRGYENLIGSSPLFGTTDVAKVAEDFAGNRTLWKNLATEAEGTLAALPSRETFKTGVAPFLDAERAAMRELSQSDDDAGRFAPEIEDRLREAGLVIPGSRRGTPVTAKIVRSTNEAGELVEKPVVDIDMQVQKLIQQGRTEEAADLLYDQVENVARLTPQSLVDLARARGGSMFYPVRSGRNQRWAELVGLPQRVIGRGTSIGSANAGPYVEEFRTLSLLPFIDVDRKTGLAFFDRAAAIKAYGEKAFKAAKNSVSLLDQQADAMVKLINNPDYLTQGAKGLSDKTWVYDIMEADPRNPLALVADNIGATARTGVSYATLPGSTTQSMYGQLPERVVAQALGIQPSALQEIDWLVSRILRGEGSSAVPFGRVIREADMERVAAGQLMHKPHSMNPSEEAIAAASEAVAKRTSKRKGGLASQDLQDLAAERRRDWTPADDVLYTPEGLPNPTSTAAIIQPGARSKSSIRGRADYTRRAQVMLDTIRKLGPGASAAAVAALLADNGFSSIAEMMDAAGYSGDAERDSLARMQLEQEANPLEQLARRRAARSL